ncbi:MAG: hypothetical protein WCL50_07315 [Spirochaetota bacterium]
MRTIARVSLICAMLSLAAVGSFGLDLREGVVKIAIDESSARVSLYRLVDIAKDRYEALIYDVDSRTSYITLSFEGRQYKLGDSADFRQNISRTDKGATIEFKSSFARVTESLEFARSAGAAIADGIRVSFVVENVSQKDATIGLRFLVDTYLGEKSGLHFRTPTKAKVTTETFFEGSTLEAWVASPGDNSIFMVQFIGEGLAGPSTVHLANWKRLNDAPWSIEPSNARNFTLLPYSVNDSALALYWQPKTIAKGATLSASVAMGSWNEKGYPPASADSGANDLFSKTVLAQQGSGDMNSLIASDLLSVRDLLSRIDLVLSSGVAPGADEIASWRKILDLLEDRKKGY